MSQGAVQDAQTILDLVQSIADPNLQESEHAYKTRYRIQDACDALLQKVLGPLEYTVLVANCYHESQAIYFITVLEIPDVIGDGALDISYLSEKAQVEEKFLYAAMNLLRGRGFFEEVGDFGSRMFKNNELSNFLRQNHETTLKQAVGFLGDEGFKSSARLLDAARLDQSGKKAVNLPASNIAFGFDCSIFDWMASPEQAWRGERLGKAMQQLHSMCNSNISKDYPWKDLQSPIVNVGGGIGSLEMSILRDEQNRHLRFQIFDIPKTISNAEKIWAAKPSDVSSCISFASGNFMQEDSGIPRGQPTYVLSHVLHDWTDDEVLTILGNVRTAMNRQGRLVYCEILLAPDSSRFVRAVNLQLMTLNRGISRTVAAMEELLHRAGFKVERIHTMRAASTIIESIPM